MEFILIVAAFALAGWWVFFRKDPSSQVEPAAPYKVETPPVNAKSGDVVEPVAAKPESVNTQITDAVTQAAPEPAPVQEEVKPVAEAPAKKPRKPRTPKAEVKPAVKKAAPKKAAAIKAKPKTPRSKKA